DGKPFLGVLFASIVRKLLMPVESTFASGTMYARVFACCYLHRPFRLVNVTVKISPTLHGTCRNEKSWSSLRNRLCRSIPESRYSFPQNQPILMVTQARCTAKHLRRWLEDTSRLNLLPFASSFVNLVMVHAPTKSPALGRKLVLP